MSNRTIAFIPARCGSKSIPMKNIKLFCGKPLIYWNLKELQETEAVDAIFVATDCSEIENVVDGFGFNKVKIYRRLPQNAADTSSTESVMLEFIRSGVSLDPRDNFILVQATSPLTTRVHFTEAVHKFKEEGYDSLLTCVRVKDFFWNENGTPINYDYTRRPRRQDFNGMLAENGAFYISSIGAIQKNQCRLSGKIGVYEMPEYTTVEIDEEYDWIVAESLMRRFFIV